MEIKQLYQNKLILSINIQHEGCYYIDLANIYQEVAEHQLEYELLNAVYVMATRTRNFDGKLYMEKDCFINDISGVSQLISGLTKIPVFMKQVHEYEKYTHIIGEFERVTRRGIVVDHFVELFLDSNKVKRDPWQGGSRTAKVGILKGKRFILTRRL